MMDVFGSIPEPARKPRTDGDRASVPRPQGFVAFPEQNLERSITARFEQVVAARPHELALVWKDTALTYETLNVQANRMAHGLLRHAISEGSDTPVGVLMEHGPQQITAILAALKVGRAYAVLDPSFPKARLAHMLEHSQARAVVTNDANGALAHDLAPATDILNTERLEADLPETNCGLTIRPEAVANIYYTSGSTGKPKGVMHSHRTMLHSIMSATNDYGLCAMDRIALLFSAGFAASITPTFGALLNGAVLLPYDLKRDGFAALADWLIENEITYYSSVPSAFRRFASTLQTRHSFPRLRVIVLGGEPVRKADVELYKKHFSSESRLCVRLAGTEMHRIRSYVIDKHTTIVGGVVPVGYPVKDKEVLLLDSEGKEVAIGQSGEITVRSRYLAVGYWGEPERSRTSFRVDPEDELSHTYRTGDLGRLRLDGCLEHLGRIDSQVKIRGHRIELAEVETAILGLPSVLETAVVAQETPKKGFFLVGYVIPKIGVEPKADVLRTELSKTLPEYMIPSYFMSLDALPLTATGKIDHRGLPKPDHTRPALETPFQSPQNSAQVQIQELWQDVLETRPIGINDNFFDLGGDSLAAVELLTQVNATLGVDLPPDVLIQAPSIARMTNVLGEREHSRFESPLVAVQPSGSRPPFYYVPGMAANPVSTCRLGRCLAPDQPLYTFRDPRLWSEKTRYMSVSELASLYLEALRQHQQDGPYYLGGHSFGCLIAYEMACQLAKAGHRVGLLVFLDMRGRYHSRSLTPYARLGIRHLLRQHGLLSFVHKATRAIRQRLLPVTEAHVPEATRFPALIQVCKRARDAYLPKPYGGRVVLFQTRENAEIPHVWQGLITGGIDVYEVPGDHWTMLQEPHVGVLARKLMTCLSEHSPMPTS